MNYNFDCEGDNKSVQDYLDSLPDDITSLNVKFAPIAVPFTVLPDLRRFSTLQKLFCHSCGLERICELPDSLEFINCICNELATLPTLPKSLKELLCVGNRLTTLPALPESLKSLYCADNCLTALPPLPESLKVLECRLNFLNALPTLPSKLKALVCPHNEIYTLPELPEVLVHLECQNNNLDSIPERTKMMKEYKVGQQGIKIEYEKRCERVKTTPFKTHYTIAKECNDRWKSQIESI